MVIIRNSPKILFNLTKIEKTARKIKDSHKERVKKKERKRAS